METASPPVIGSEWGGCRVARTRREPEVVVRVTYVTDPENARAAQEILNEGFRRALTKLIHEKRRKETEGGVA